MMFRIFNRQLKLRPPALPEVNPLGAGSWDTEEGARSVRDYWGLQEAAADHPMYRSLSAFHNRHGCASECQTKLPSWGDPRN